MKTEFYSARAKLLDAKSKSERRFRHILANSGDIMESGEIRDLEQLYVMGRDGKLIKVSDLNTNPDKQTEDYTVKAQADHGQVIDGEIVPSMEKQFGSCKVWLEDDGLHARMYFANEDALADHAWAISEDASYSTGIDWYPDGYYGTGYEIEEPIGILREISMVLTGNDPRAKTIDSKPVETEGDVKAVETVDGETNSNKENSMSKKLDELTPDEREAMGREIAGVLNKYTADVPEDETQPTATDTKDDVEVAEGEQPAEAPAETPAEEKTPEEEAAEVIAEEAKEESTDTKVKEEKDTLHMPIINVVKSNDAVKQEAAAEKKDWRTSLDAKKRFAELAYQNQGFKGSFDSMWAAELAKHEATTNDGITGLGLPVDGRQLVIDALEKSEGLISHFDFIGGKTYLVKLISAADGNDAETARAGAHTKGEEKLFQALKSDPRAFYTVPVYKKLDIDYLELYENPELIDIRARELVEARIVEIERAMVIGDGRSAGTPDRRMFREDSGRGFYSMVKDATTAGIGQLFATAVTAPAGSNLYDASILAENAIRAEGRRIMVAKKSLITGFRTARLNGAQGDYILKPGASLEEALGVARVYAPAWMDNAACDFVMFVENTPKLIGKAPASPDMKTFFDTTTDVDVLMAEGPNGGGLAAYKAAAVVTIES